MIVDKNNQKPVVVLENFLIRNTIAIKKYACKNDVCGFESNAEFNVIDKNGDVVTTLKTSELGYASTEVGYGNYRIQQIAGKKDYSLADEYSEKVVDESSLHYKELFNKFNSVEQIKKEDIKIKEVKVPKETDKVLEEEIEEVPSTRVDYNYHLIIQWILLLFSAFRLSMSINVKED